MTQDEQEALTRLKESFGGKVLIRELQKLLNQDVMDLITAEPHLVAGLQGSAMRTQVLLHLLEAEYIPGEEDYVES